MLSKVWNGPKKDLFAAGLSARSQTPSVFGQLPPTQAALGDALKARALEVVGFEAPLGGRKVRQKAIKHAPWDPDNAFVFADGDAKFHGLPLVIPAGIRGKGEEHVYLRVLRPGVFVISSRPG